MGYPKRVGPCVLLRFRAAPNLSFPRFFCGPLEMLSNFVKSFVKLLLYQAQQQAKLRESAKKDEGRQLRRPYRSGLRRFD
jgi:hypothetical protein